MNAEMKKQVHRGDVFLTDLGPIRVADRRGVLPVLILRESPGDSVIVAADIKRHPVRGLRPTHVQLKGAACGTFASSAVTLERIRILDRDQLGAFMGNVGEDKMREVESALSVRMGLKNP